MRSQEKTVVALYGNADDNVAMWHHSCGKLRLLDSVTSRFFHGSGGTQPVSILQELAAVDQIKRSDLWILLTDGEISERGVSELTQAADVLDAIQIPMILVVSGGRYSTPDQSKISVGIPFFASAPEALILFKDYFTGQIFVIDAKGVFAPLKPEFAKGASS